MTQIIILLSISYLLLIVISVYFYINGRKNKKRIIQIEEKYIKEIDDLKSKLPKINEIQNQPLDLTEEFNKLSVQISSEFAGLSSPILNKFIEIKSDISQLNEFFKDKVEEMMNGFNLINEKTKELKEQVVILQSNLINLGTYFSKSNIIKEQFNKLSEELQKTINPNDIVIDEDNITEQVQTIIDYTVMPKTKTDTKKIIDMIDNGEIEIK